MGSSDGGLATMRRRAVDARELARRAREFAEICGERQIAANLQSYADDLESEALGIDAKYGRDSEPELPAQAMPENAREAPRGSRSSPETAGPRAG